jgi:hypothetical protein
MEISSTFWIQDITDWWHQQEDTHSNYVDLSNVARNIFSIVPHAVAVEADLPLAKMLLAVGSQEPQARPIAKMILEGSAHKPITGLWQPLSQSLIPQTHITTWN